MGLLRGRFGTPCGGWGGQGVERHAAACHRSPPEKEKAVLARPLVLDRLGRKFLLCPLLSGYQVQHQNTPNIFERIRAEVVWNVGENFRTEDEKLDRFPHLAGLGENWQFGAEGVGFGRGRVPVPGIRTRPNHGRRFSTPSSQNRARRGPRFRAAFLMARLKVGP